MYGQCLITPTILDAYEFATSAPPSWKERAETSFIAKLKREKEDYPAWVKRGKDFEDTVTRICNKSQNKTLTSVPTKQGSDHFNRVCGVCQGGRFQEKLSKSLIVDAKKVFLFGYCDVTFPDLIVDIKTTLKYSGESKYLKGHQHLIYCYIKQIPNFKYIVVEWLNETDDTIKDVHEINYAVTDFESLEDHIVKIIINFFEYLRNKGLWLDYYQTFSKN